MIKPVDDDDLIEFLLQAQLLHDCTYMQKPIKKIVLSFDENFHITAKGDMPSKEILDSFLMSIRPFIEKPERLYIARIIKYLVDTHGDSEHLRLMSEEFNKESKFPAIQVDGISYPASQILYLYMYGKYFHLDKGKQEIFRAIDKSLGHFGEYTALSQLERLAGIALGVAGDIKRLKLK